MPAIEILGHKREFSYGVELYVRLPVSFVYEVTEKGGLARKIREEDNVANSHSHFSSEQMNTVVSMKGFLQGLSIDLRGTSPESIVFFECLRCRISNVFQTGGVSQSNMDVEIPQDRLVRSFVPKKIPEFFWLGSLANRDLERCHN